MNECDPQCAPQGYYAVLAPNGGCKGCALQGRGFCHTVPCSPSERPDKQHVIFKEVPTDE